MIEFENQQQQVIQYNIGGQFQEMEELSLQENQDDMLNQLENEVNQESMICQQQNNFSTGSQMKVLIPPITNKQERDNLYLDCPKIKNHSVILYKNSLIIFGGYDGLRNHNVIHIYAIQNQKWAKPKINGQIPEGRNGHSATLIGDKMYVIGGWLGAGPYASSEIYIFDLINFTWQICQTNGGVPGPCNMHSADFLNNQIYIFRGGDGKDYLNDLHTLNVITNFWKQIVTEKCPSPRANHSSAVINNKIYIFGGWDGSKRLNDLHYFDTITNQWTEIFAKNKFPLPRAGMAVANLNDKFIMFGGSGYSAKCFNDLSIYDPQTNSWSMPQIVNQDKIKSRAGHSLSVVGDYLFIIGGSFAQQYFKDFHIIDTNPAPTISTSINDSKTRLIQLMRDQCNNKTYSDITFIVEGKPFYGHKVILSLLCERFRGLFNMGMQESKSDTIELKDINYNVFAAVCEYLYTGEIHFGAETEGQELSEHYLLEFLQISDEFIIDDIKIECEKHLIRLLKPQNIERIYNAATQYNANQLKKYCLWYKKNQMKKKNLTESNLNFIIQQQYNESSQQQQQKVQLINQFWNKRLNDFSSDFEEISQ